MIQPISFSSQKPNLQEDERIASEAAAAQMQGSAQSILAMAAELLAKIEPEIQMVVKQCEEIKEALSQLCSLDPRLTKLSQTMEKQLDTVETQLEQLKKDIEVVGSEVENLKSCASITQDQLKNMLQEVDATLQKVSNVMKDAEKTISSQAETVAGPLQALLQLLASHNDSATP